MTKSTTLHRLSPLVKTTTKNRILFLSSTLLPEPSASAAGVRTESLLNHFSRRTNLFHHVDYGSPATTTTPNNPSSTSSSSSSSESIAKSSCQSNLERHGVSFHHIPPNNTKIIKSWLDRHGPVDAVIFDRFYSEEAYSFHFHHEQPHALRILDMQDMHSLRSYREDLVKAWDETHDDMMDETLMSTIMTSVPQTQNEKLLRELASIHRSDLVMVCSPHEKQLLQNEYGINEDKLILAPFFTNVVKNEDDPPFSRRFDISFLGGFRHSPNRDAVSWLSHEIWPRLKTKLPSNDDIHLHIYGAYPDNKIKSHHDPSNRIHIRGRAASLSEVFQTTRLLLCPLRYGAGIKGKIVDAWRWGVPVVTTPIGAEGMMEGGYWIPGVSIGSTVEDIVDCVERLYADETLWEERRRVGLSVLRRLYDGDRNLGGVEEAIEKGMREREERRGRDYSQAMLWREGARCTEYFSRWIELKERGRTK